jgi:signal transduction histidine kinase
MPAGKDEVIIVLITGTSITLMFLLLVVVSLFINQKRRSRHNKQITDMKHNFEKEILKAQLEIQTRTFESVSHELHDNVSNTVALALINLSLLEPGEMAKDNPKVLEAHRLIKEASQTIRDYSRNINPANLSRQGMIQSLDDLTGKFKNLNYLTIDFSQKGEEFTIDASAHIIIYRIVQEALSNSIKHSCCSEIKINLIFDRPNLQISVCDNGQGFDLTEMENKKPRKKSLGLSNMMSRAAMIEAELTIVSAPGNGTQLKLNYISKDK